MWFSRISIIFIASSILAQEISFSASCDKTEVSIGESFTLKVTVSGNIRNVPKPILPPLTDFDVYSSGRSQNISIINGRVSSSVTFTYILSPKKTGKFTIPPCKLKFKKKVYETSSIDINVVKGQLKAPQKISPQKKVSKAPSVMPEQKGKDIFITTKVDKKRVYVSEQILLTFRFYQGVNLMGNPEYTPPQATGFWKEDLGQSEEYKLINGKQYHVAEVRYALFPTSPGKYTISPATLRCTIDNFFSHPFDLSLGRGENKVLKSNPITITVLPFPEEGKPKDFSGAVGKFSLNSKIDKENVKQNEPVTLSIIISGSGNIKSISKPQFPNPSGFKLYESGSKIKMFNTATKVKGEKIFNIMLIPQVSGKYTIPPFKFSYFNPTLKQYKKLKTMPIYFTVAPGISTKKTVGKEEIEVVGKDIHYIKTEGGFRNEGIYVYQNKPFLFLQILPLILFAIGLQLSRRREKLRADIGYARASRARKVARGLLLNANKLKKTGQVKEFYGVISLSVTGYISDKLNIKAPLLTIPLLVERLREKNIPDTLIERVKNILELADFARFATAKFSREDMDKAEKEVEDIINKLERKI